jgi:hypothetical protein
MIESCERYASGKNLVKELEAFEAGADRKGL